MTTQTDRYKFEIGINSEQISGSIEALTKAAAAAKRLERSFRDVEATVDGIDRIREALSRLFTEMQGKAEGISETSRALQRLARVASTAQATIDKAAAKVNESAKAHGKLEGAARRAETAIDGVGDEARSAGNQIEAAARDADGAGSSLRRLAAGAGSVASGMLSAELAMRAVTGVLEVLRSGVEAYSENTEEGAKAQDEFTTALDITRTAIGQAVVESEAYKLALKGLNYVAANSEELSRQLKIVLDAMLIVVRSLATTFTSFSSSVDDADGSMAGATTTARSMGNAMSQIALAAVNAAIALERVMGVSEQIENIAAMSPVGMARDQLLGIERDANLLERMAGTRAESAGRIAELEALRAQLLAGPGFTQTEEETQAALERSIETFEQGQAAAERYREAAAGGGGGGGGGGRGGGGRAAEQETYTFEEDPVIQAEILHAQETIEQIRQMGLQAAADRERDRADQIARRKLEIEQEIELERERAAELAAIQAEEAEAAATAAQAQAEKMRSIYSTAAESVMGPLSEIYGAGIDKLLDGEGEKLGTSARRIIGQQLVSLGQSALSAAALFNFADPAVGFLPNPARSAATAAAGLAAIAAGKALGAVDKGGNKSKPARETPKNETQQQMQQITNINFAGGTFIDERRASRAITQALQQGRQQGAIR